MGDLVPEELRQVQVLDRHGIPLTVTYRNRWNLHDRVPLHRMPEFLQQALLFSEDRRFWVHHGVDWRARLHALWQNLRALKAVRGASKHGEKVSVVSPVRHESGVVWGQQKKAIQ